MLVLDVVMVQVICVCLLDCLMVIIDMVIYFMGSVCGEFCVVGRVV